LKKKDIQWEKAFETENSRKKGKLNIYRTFESKPDKKGFRTIFIHSSSKQQDDENKRQKRIKKALSELGTLSPKVNILALWARIFTHKNHILIPVDFAFVENGLGCMQQPKKKGRGLRDKAG
jgi:hypothetical protein